MATRPLGSPTAVFPDSKPPDTQMAELLMRLPSVSCVLESSPLQSMVLPRKLSWNQFLGSPNRYLQIMGSWVTCQSAECSCNSALAQRTQKRQQIKESKGRCFSHTNWNKCGWGSHPHANPRRTASYSLLPHTLSKYFQQSSLGGASS